MTFVASNGSFHTTASPARISTLDVETFHWLASSVDHARAAIAGLLPLHEPVAPARPEAARIAWPPVTQTFAAWDALRQRLAQAAGDQSVILTDGNLNEDGRRRLLGELADRVDADVATTTTTMRNLVDRVIADLEKLATPPRPAIDHAADAALERRGAMVLDPLATPGEVVARIAQFASDAALERDAHALWFWAAGPWPRLYLEARGGLFAMHAPDLDAAIAAVLDRSGDAGIADARALLAVLRGGDGLAAALIAAETIGERFFAPARAGRP